MAGKRKVYAVRLVGSIPGKGLSTVERYFLREGNRESTIKALQEDERFRGVEYVRFTIDLED